jgi:glucarate dehydratase
LHITDIRLHCVNLPLEAPYRWSTGQYGGATKCIVEIQTDEGAVGLGELPSVELRPLVETDITPRLIGADPLNVNDCFNRCVPEITSLRNTHDAAILKAFGGVEIGLWDLKGIAAGRPLCDLLGGSVRREVRFSEYFALRASTSAVRGEASPTEVAAYCARMREEHGSRVFEGKVGVVDLDTEVAIVREVRSAIGDDATLRLDANMGWPLGVARDALARIAPYRIANLEDPVASFWDMAKLRVHSSIPFSSHLPDPRLAVHLGVPDTLVVNIAQRGGIAQTLKLIAACEELGVGFWFYSGDAGVGTAAYLQLSAAIPYLTQPHQSLLRWYIDDVIEGGPFRPHNDTVTVPDGPGLGVTLDRKALRRCVERFERDGVIRQLGRPGEPWYPQLPRQ